MHSEHGDGHIGNTLSMSASAYQGNAFIHLPRRPLRALGCGPEAIVLVEQNSSSSLPIWLDTRHSTLQVLYLTSTPAQSEGLACSLGLHIGSQTLLWQNQCVVRNAKLSHCETVRNVSHGLRRRPQAGETCETSFALTACAKLFPHRQSGQKL
jgi:hypothetical protein